MVFAMGEGALGIDHGDLANGGEFVKQGVQGEIQAGVDRTVLRRNEFLELLGVGFGDVGGVDDENVLVVLVFR